MYRSNYVFFFNIVCLVFLTPIGNEFSWELALQEQDKRVYFFQIFTFFEYNNYEKKQNFLSSMSKSI